MRRLVISICRIAAVLTMGVVAMAGPDNPSQTCKANGNFGVSHDTCVTCFAQGLVTGPPSPVCSCKILHDLGALEAAGFKNLGQCISSGYILGQ